MSRVFTEYVRSLSADELPDPDLFTKVWEKLKGALIAEMRQRGLWTSPPSYLGIHGPASWSEPDALDELAGDVYTFVFRRLPSLRKQAEVKSNVEGLFFRSIRNFLYDTQKKHDPVGFRVFVTAQTATLRAIDAEALHVLAGDPKIANDTTLGNSPGNDPAEAADAEFDEHVRGWSDQLLPELVTARGKEKDRVTEHLMTLLLRLPEVDIEVFLFKSLVDPLKRTTRVRWSAIWDGQEGETALESNGDGELVTIVRLVRPEAGVENREAFAKLLAGVAKALERLDEAPKTRGYLDRLWLFLRDHAAQPEDDKMPSQRQIARELGIPRERLPGLYATLGQLVEECQAAISGKPQLRGINESFRKELEVQASVFDSLGLVYMRRGHYESAKPLLEESLRIRRETLRDDHLLLAESQINLAFLLDKMGQYRLAEPLLRQGLAIQRQHYPKTHRELAKGINTHATVLYTLGEYDSAELLYREALKMKIDLYGENHLEVATSFARMGAVRSAKDDYEAAQRYYQKALNIHEALLPSTHPVVARTYNQMGVSLVDQRLDGEAVPFLRKALEIRRQVHGNQHPEVAASLFALALSLHRLGQYDEAEKYYRESLEIRCRVYGVDRDKCLEVRKILPLLLAARGDVEAAHELALRVLLLAKVPGESRHLADAVPGLEQVRPRLETER